MPTIDWNKSVWDKSYTWPQDGDEWSEMAAFCGVPYEKWKDQLRRTFMVPYVRPESTVLEIGAGHGRWSSMLPPKVFRLHLVDLSASCIEFCKKRLSVFSNVFYHVNDGRTLSAIEASSVDFVWSFDSFVHIEEPEVRSYARELKRVMKPQVMGVIHHPGSPTPEQKASGCRSAVDGRKFAAILAENGLHMIRQTSEWGDGCNMQLTGGHSHGVCKTMSDPNAPLENWNYGATPQFPYGDETSYKKAMDFLDGPHIVEDWGCGVAWARKFVKRGRYIGIDGSWSMHCDLVTDLRKYRSTSAGGILIRHILEHSWGWRQILENALASFQQKFCLVLFTPFGEVTRSIGSTKENVPDISFKKEDLLEFLKPFSYTEESIQSATQYGVEHFFYITKKQP